MTWATALPCPCCGCRTLPARGGFDICPVCFWEDDGTAAPDVPSPVNRMLCLLEAANFYTAWGAVDPEFVHSTRLPTVEEAPPGTPHAGGRPYDRWPSVEVAPGVRFGWVGPTQSYGVGERDGFLALADGRRAGLQIHGDPSAGRPRARPVDGPVLRRDAVLEVHVPGHYTSTEVVVPLLRAGFAAELVALIPAATPAGGVPQLVDVGSPSRTYAGGGHGELRTQASPDDPEAVARWAEGYLRAAVQPGDEVAELGHWSWVLRRRSAGYLEVWGVSVAPAEPGPGLPPGTRCVLTWSSGSFPEARPG